MKLLKNESTVVKDRKFDRFPLKEIFKTALSQEDIPTIPEKHIAKFSKIIKILGFCMFCFIMGSLSFKERIREERKEVLDRSIIFQQQEESLFNFMPQVDKLLQTLLKSPTEEQVNFSIDVNNLDTCDDLLTNYMGIELEKHIIFQDDHQQNFEYPLEPKDAVQICHNMPKNKHLDFIIKKNPG